MHVDTLRVLIVVGHRMFRQGLAALLKSAEGISVVGTAASCAEMSQMIRHHRPHVVLIDDELSDGDCFHATRTTLQLVADAKVVILVVDDTDPRTVYLAIRAGAMGVVSKFSAVDGLINAIRLVAKSQAALATSSLNGLLAYMASAAEGSKERTPAVARLSAREREVLDLVAEGKSNREIARLLVLSESTVRSHLHNILDKLGLSNRVQAAAVALSSTPTSRVLDQNGTSARARHARTTQARHGRPIHQAVEKPLTNG